MGGQRGIVGWAHLTVLWSFAVAQPLFGVLAESPEFFVARGNTAGDILLFALAVVLLPPAVLFVLARLAERLGPLGAFVQPALVGLLVAAIALQLLQEMLDGPAAALAIAALGIGAGGALAYARRGAVRTALTLLAPAPLLFLVLFLAVSPVSKLVLDTGPIGEEGAAVRGGPPVVMVVFDEFSTEVLMDASRRIDASRFPNFASLARDATWYRNATTVSDHTTDAVPAVLTGRLPRKGALPIAADHPRSLFTLLGESYSMANVNEAATDVCPAELCGERTRAPTAERLSALAEDLGIVYLHRLLPEGLTASLPPVDRSFGNFAGQGDIPATDAEVIPETAQFNRAEQFKRFVAGIPPPSGQPALSFLHVLLPHTYWQYLPGGRQYPVAGPDIPGLDDRGAWSANPYFARQGRQRNLLQTGFVDQLVGRLTARLRRLRLYDRALIVLVADHGVSFRPGAPRRTATGPAFPGVAGIPLLVKLPGQVRGRVDDGRASLVDVLPTIADVLEVEPGWDLDGVSLLKRERLPTPITVRAHPDLDPTSLSFDAFVRARNADVARTAGRDGARGWASAFAIGPDRALVGLRPAPLDSAPRGAASVQLDGAPQLASYEPASPVAPAFVTGRLSGMPAGRRVAVAVNGRVWDVTYSYAAAGGEVRVGAMVPPPALRRGRNDVRLYEVRGDAGRAAALRPIGQSGGAYAEARLVKRGGGWVVERDGQPDIEVVDGVADGYLDGVLVEPGSLGVVGWATDAEHRRPAGEVLVFGDGRLIAGGRPALPRPDVASTFERPSLRPSGFQIVATTGDAVELATPERLRVLAVVGDRASVLALEAEQIRRP